MGFRFRATKGMQASREGRNLSETFFIIGWMGVVVLVAVGETK